MKDLNSAIVGYYESDSMFPVPEHDLNEFLGYVRKDGVRRLFLRNKEYFKKGEDYIVVYDDHTDVTDNHSTLSQGINPNKPLTYYFTIDTAKELGLMAETQYGHDFRRITIKVGNEYMKLLRLHNQGYSEAQNLFLEISEKYPGIGYMLEKYPNFKPLLPEALESVTKLKNTLAKEGYFFFDVGWWLEEILNVSVDSFASVGDYRAFCKFLADSVRTMQPERKIKQFGHKNFYTPEDGLVMELAYRAWRNIKR